MSKKRSYQPVLIAITVLFLIFASFLTYYFGFRKETIYGVPSEVKVGDVIKFHAIAQVGGRAGIICYAEPDIVTGNPDCQLCTRFSLGKKELKDGCNGLPCNLYDQWSFSPKEAKNEMGFNIKYTCSGVTAPPNDKLSFSVKEATTPCNQAGGYFIVVGVDSCKSGYRASSEPIAGLQCCLPEDAPDFIIQPVPTIEKVCTDSDGNDITKFGNVHYYSSTYQYNYYKDDTCVNDATVTEWTCDSGKIGVSNNRQCPSGTKCVSGACSTSGGTTGGASGTSCQAPLYLSTATNTCKTCETGDKGTFCRDNKRYFITTSIALTPSNDRTCVDEERLFEICSDDEICNKDAGCVPNVEIGTTRNKKCINNEQYSSVNYEEFQSTAKGGQWMSVNEFCIGDQFCDPETLQCELKENAPKVKTNETAKEEKKTLTEFDFNEFFKTYGIAVGISAFLFVVLIIFIVATRRKKK